MKLLLHSHDEAIAFGFRTLAEARGHHTRIQLDRAAFEAECRDPREVVILDEYSSPVYVLNLLSSHKPEELRIVWRGHWISNWSAAQMIAAGVAGIVWRSSSIEAALECCAQVEKGSTWYEQDLISRVMKLQRAWLTPRETECLPLVAKGWSNKAIGVRMGIQPDTVAQLVKGLCLKLGATQRFELVALYCENFGHEWEREGLVPSMVISGENRAA